MTSPSPLQRTASHRYSLLRAIREASDSDGRLLSGLEREISDEIAIRTGRTPRGFFLPLSTPAGPERRAVNLDIGAGAVATILPVTAIDILRSKLICAQAGALIGDFTDQAGQLAMPRISTAAATSWVGDGVAPMASSPTLDQVLFTAHTVCTYIDITRKMVHVATRDFQDLVLLPDIAASIAHEIDRSAINGLGSAGVPLGILQDPAVPTTLATGALTWSDVCDIEATVSEANADAAADAKMAWVASPQLRSKLRRTSRGTTTDAGLKIWTDDGIAGYPAYVSTSVPANIQGVSDTSTSCLIFGNFADFVIQMFSYLDVVVNPYLQSTTGVIRISAFLDCDVRARHPQSFAKAVGISTT